MFDLTRKETLDNLPNLINTLFKSAGEVPVMFLGNKKDMTDNIQVTNQDIERVIAPYNGKYLLTSAKTGENVENGFHELGKKLLEDV